MAKSKRCPCGKKADYGDCCGRYIDGKELPSTPQDLMRSRFTAYSLANVDYIADTMQGSALQFFDKDKARAFAESATWMTLNVLRHEMLSETQAVVEFVVDYQVNNQDEQIHERSLFEKVSGRWFYIDKI